MASKGVRLYCPQCKDNAFFTEEELAQYPGGEVDCGNHAYPVEMVNLAEFMKINGFGSNEHLVEPEPEVEFA